MKKTQLTDAARNIRKRFVSYLSICLVVMLGVGIFLTTGYMEAGIMTRAAEYYGDRGLKDFELISSLGASKNNIDAVRAAEGVVAAEGVMEYEGSMARGDVKRSVTALSVTDTVSVPLLTDGAMPSAADECAIGEDFSEESGIRTGDRVNLYLKSFGDEDPLKVHSFTVTGLVKHPDYIHRKLTNVTVLPLSAFSMEDTDGAFTRVFVKTGEVPAEDFFTEEYFRQTSGTRAALAKLTGSLAADRADEVRNKAYTEIDKEWEKAVAGLEAAQAEIDSGEAELNAGLKAGRDKLSAAESKLAKELKKYNKQLKNGKLSISEYEKKLKEGRKNLKEKKALYEQARALFEAKIEGVEKMLETVRQLLALLDGSGDQDTEEYIAYEQAVAAYIIDNQIAISSLVDLSKNEDIRKAVKDIDSRNNTDCMKYADAIAGIGIDGLVSEALTVRDGGGHFSRESLSKTESSLQVIADSRKAFDEAAAVIADAEKQLADAEKTLAKKKAELKAAKKKLSKKKSEAESKIRKGWSDYYSQKAAYESKLEEAKALLEQNRGEAEEKLAEAKAAASDVSCEWIVLDRNASSGYIDIRVILDSLRSAGLVFGILFLIISALVCLSTLVIIIEEQKKLIGTVKAFGFHRTEILSKYLLFGVSAAVIGDILAFFTGVGLSSLVQNIFSATNVYQYGNAGIRITILPTLLITAAMIAVCAAASVTACLSVLRSPASMLMKGQTMTDKGKKGKKTVSSGRIGSLYTRLIMRNIRDDKARVTVSIAIIAFCCMLIGLGISLKLSLSGVMSRQENEVNLYDMRLDIGDSVTPEERAALIDVLKNSSAAYTEVLYESHLFNTGNTITGMSVLAGDPDELKDYYGIPDSGFSSIPEDGLLIPLRMSEVYGFRTGDSFCIFDSSMQSREAAVSGTYTCYFGRVAVTTPEAYRDIFGSNYNAGSCLIMLNGEDRGALKNALAAVSGDVSFEDSDDFMKSLESVGSLYDLIVYVCTAFAIIMSFMILTNLANIFLARRKNELIIMRINGFSIGQARGYLVREAVLTTLAGLAAGVLLGSLMTPAAVRIIEPVDMQFDRSYQLIAWFIAGGLEGLFALLIYGNIFRRIRHFKLKDIV